MMFSKAKYNVQKNYFIIIIIIKQNLKMFNFDE